MVCQAYRSVYGGRSSGGTLLRSSAASSGSSSTPVVGRPARALSFLSFSFLPPFETGMTGWYEPSSTFWLNAPPVHGPERGPQLQEPITAASTNPLVSSTRQKPAPPVSPVSAWEPWSGCWRRSAARAASAVPLAAACRKGLWLSGHCDVKKLVVRSRGCEHSRRAGAAAR